MIRPRTKLKDGAKTSEILMVILANKSSSLTVWEAMMVAWVEAKVVMFRETTWALLSCDCRRMLRI